MHNFCKKIITMPDNFINITALNDFLFCPYSIYLHNVFMDMDEDIFVAKPQVKGKAAHKAIDSRAFSENENDVQSLKVFSNELGLVGVIDLYRKEEKHLIEYKYKVGDSLFLGQKMQLWAQYFCLIEMGYMVQKISIYEKSTGIFHDVKIPDNDDKQVLTDLIRKFREFDFSQPMEVNIKKCTHCIYCNLCHFTDYDNVYNN